jgi:hypothetical protein
MFLKGNCGMNFQKGKRKTRKFLQIEGKSIIFATLKVLYGLDWI